MTVTTAPPTPWYRRTYVQVAAVLTVVVAVAAGVFLYLETQARNDQRDLAWGMCQQRIKTDTGYRDFTFYEPTERQDGDLYRFAGNVDIGSGFTFGEYRFSCVIDPYGSALDDEVTISRR